MLEELAKAIKERIKAQVIKRDLTCVVKGDEVVVTSMPFGCRIGFELDKKDNITLYINYEKTRGWHKMNLELGLIHNPNCDIEKGIDELLKMLGYPFNLMMPSFFMEQPT